MPICATNPDSVPAAAPKGLNQARAAHPAPPRCLRPVGRSEAGLVSPQSKQVSPTRPRREKRRRGTRPSRGGQPGTQRSGAGAPAMPGIRALLLAVFIFVAGPLLQTVGARGTDIPFDSLKLVNKVTNTEAPCPEGLHRGGQFCCRPCPPGKWKADDCSSDNGEPKCRPCRKGKEYTDKEHYASRCRRCAFCDAEHGLEVERNCTLTQDTKCRCKANFYCSTPVCEHCEPCDTCEHGIREKCTPTSNTECRTEATDFNLWWLCGPVLLSLVLAFGLYMYNKFYRNNHPLKQFTHSTPETEIVLLNYSDLDFSKYIPRIAELMKINEVRELVRKNGVPETKIDDIKNDSSQDTAEQKVQLLRSWYQVNGKKNAYRTFMEILKEAKYYAYSQKVQDIIEADRRNSHENSSSVGENERQSLA